MVGPVLLGLSQQAELDKGVIDVNRQNGRVSLSIMIGARMPTTKWVAPTVAMFSFLLINMSCKKQTITWGGTIKEVDGVTIVMNPRVPMLGESAFSIEETLSIGSKDGGREYTFAEIADLGVDEEGNIYVLDSRDALIKVFNNVGSYIRTIGRRGQGPGEMQRPTNLAMAPANQILVNDRGARVLQVFGRDGKYHRSISLARSSTSFFSRPKVDSQNNIVARSTFFKEDGKASFVLAKYDADMNELFRVFTYEYLVLPNTRNVYPPDCFWAISNRDSLIWGYSNKYELLVLDKNGRIMRKIIQDYEPLEITTKEKEEWARFAFGDQGVPSNIKVNWPDHHNAFNYLEVDDSGKIFVQTYKKAENTGAYYYDVFDPEGRYLAQVPLNAAPRAIKKDSIYTVEEDDDGYHHVKRYKINWKT